MKIVASLEAVRGIAFSPGAHFGNDLTMNTAVDIVFKFHCLQSIAEMSDI